MYEAPLSQEPDLIAPQYLDPFRELPAVDFPAEVNENEALLTPCEGERRIFVHNTRPDVELIVTFGTSNLDDSDLPDHGTFLAKPYRIEQLQNAVRMKLMG